MPKIVLNQVGQDRLKDLTDAGSVNGSDAWTWSEADAAALLGDPPDWEAYGTHFLGIDEEAEAATAERYVYPFAKLVDGQPVVFVSALEAISTAAAEAARSEVQAAADAGHEAAKAASEKAGDGEEAPSADPDDGGGDSGGGKLPDPERVLGGGQVQERAVLARGEYKGRHFELRRGDIVHRDFTTEKINVRSINRETREVPLTFSSENRINRWWCTEILDHRPECVIMGRLTNKASLLVNHDADQQTGVVESAEIGSDRLGRATVRFGSSAFASEIFQDVLEEIRCHVSVGYIVHDVEERKLDGGGLEIRVILWEPVEISIVAIPADTTVGVGRAFGRALDTAVRKEGTKMPEVKNDRDLAREEERKRVKYIRELGEKFGQRDLANKHIDEGTEADQFRYLVLEEIGAARKVTQEQIREESKLGLSNDEISRFSIYRAISAMVTKNWDKAGLERESSIALAERDGKDPNSFHLAYDILAAPYRSRLAAMRAQRDITFGGAAAGAPLVGTDHLAGSMIEMLRPASVLAKMGVRVLDGLRGNIEIPRRDTGATFYVIDNETTGVTESTPTFGEITASPRSVAARVDISRRMLMQSSPAVEGLTRDDMILGMGTKYDELGLVADGTGANPTGLIYQVGIGAVVGGDNGASLSWGHIIDLKTKVAAANALRGNPGFIFSPTVAGYCQKTEKVASTAAFMMDGDERLAGFPVGQTTLMPDNLDKGTADGVCSALLFGNFDDAIYFLWGGLELKVDEITNADNFGVVLRIVSDMDFGVRHVESFAAMLDALT